MIPTGWVKKFHEKKLDVLDFGKVVGILNQMVGMLDLGKKSTPNGCLCVFLGKREKPPCAMSILDQSGCLEYHQ